MRGRGAVRQRPPGSVIRHVGASSDGRAMVRRARRAEEDRLQPQTYKALVHERLERMVLELEFPPGTRLVEAELAERFGVSKTPIREAFLMLQAEGLVE